MSSFATRFSLSAPLLFACATLVGGCAHKQATKTSTPVDTSNASSNTSTPSSGPVAKKSCSSDTDCGDGQLCLNAQCVDVDANMSACGVVRVHFNLDAADIAEADRPLLARAARCLKASTSMHVSIEGNADERGTEEYNVALGDRRAQAVKRYLESLGATPTQLQTVSYGKDNPLCTEHDEACWSKNRRAAVKPTKNGKGS